MERWKAEQGRGIEKRKIRRERVRGQKIQMREKVGKSRNTVFFQWFVAPEGRKVGSLKRRVRSQLARGEMKNCTPLWRETHFQVKMYKAHHSRTTFGSCDVEKVHAVVARSTFPSQNVQNTSASDHFWKLRCQKKCTPLWREAHFQVKMCKALGVRTTFGGSDVASLQYTTLQDITLHYATLHSTTLQLQLHNYTTTQLHNYTTTQLHNYTTTQLHSTTLHYTPLHYITLHYTTLNYTTLHYITLHYTPLHYITLHYITFHYTSLHYTTLHYTPLHYNYNYTTTLHYTKLHYTTLHYTTLHYTTLHYTTLPSTTLHYITLHYTPLHYNYNYNYTTTLHYTKLI